MEYLPQHIEALIYASAQPISLADIQSVLLEAFGVEFAEEVLLEAVDELKARYADDQHSFEIVEVAGGYQFMSKGAFHETIGTHLRQQSTKKLSRSAWKRSALLPANNRLPNRS